MEQKHSTDSSYTASSSRLSHPAPRRTHDGVGQLEHLVRNEGPSPSAIDRQLRSTEKLAWLYASVTVLRKEADTRNEADSRSLYVALHRKLLLRRASKDVEIEQ